MLGLLIARADVGLTREQALEFLWPDSDPAAAVNSLNQTVFQLRHLFDPGYRDADSPPYLVSDVDTLHLNPELVRTDLQELRRLSARINTASSIELRVEAAEQATDLVRGEYLADVQYEDWATTTQQAAHAEARRILMPLAAGEALVEKADLALRAAQALVALDPVDEAAHVAMAAQMSRLGQRAAAHQRLMTLARRLERDFDEEPSPSLAEALSRFGRSSSTD